MENVVLTSGAYAATGSKLVGYENALGFGWRADAHLSTRCAPSISQRNACALAVRQT